MAKHSDLGIISLRSGARNSALWISYPRFQAGNLHSGTGTCKLLFHLNNRTSVLQTSNGNMKNGILNEPTLTKNAVLL